MILHFSLHDGANHMLQLFVFTCYIISSFEGSIPVGLVFLDFCSCIIVAQFPHMRMVFIGINNNPSYCSLMCGLSIFSKVRTEIQVNLFIKKSFGILDTSILANLLSCTQ